MSDSTRRTVSRPLLLLLALALQVGIIGSIVVRAQTIRDEGQTVYLRIEPVDPRDPFRGDYLTFRFEDLSTLSVWNDYGTGSGTSWERGDTVYVELSREGRYWRQATGEILERIPARRTPGSTYLRATVTDTSGTGSGESTTIDVTYGVEEYFVQESTGLSFPFDRDATARIEVAEDGTAVLGELRVDGKVWP